MVKLTPKQEAFAQAYVRLGDQAAAYREVYDTSNMLAKTVHEAASRLANSCKVAARTNVVQATLAEQTEATVERITEMLNAAYDAAIASGQPGAAVSAAMGIAKVHGLLVEKRQTVNVTRSTADVDDRIRQLLAPAEPRV